MDLAESMVERFLTANGHAFVCSQYELKDVSNWRASLDFVVLDFRAKERLAANGCVIMVEVSEAGGLGSVGYKAEKCISDGYLERLERQMAEETRGVTTGWPVLFLGFLKDQALVDEAYRQFKIHQQFFFRPLRDTIENYWDRRVSGLLPDRPSGLNV